jgi:hypothetical protein
MHKALIRIGLLCGLALLYGASAAAADPSVHEIYAAAEAGHIAQAEQMIDQVLRDNPQSGKAHYVAAEIYARAGSLQRARAELNAAQQIEPGLPFANPASVSALDRQLSTARPQTWAGAAEGPHASVPWGAIILVVLAIGVVWVFIRRRVQMSSYGSYPGAAPPGPGAMGYGAAPMGGGPYYPGGGGSGLMGSLGTGLALGAGVAAGEELVRHVLDRDEPRGIISNADAGEYAPPQNGNMGGEDFGVNDSSSWSDDGGSFDSSVGGDDWT